MFSAHQNSQRRNSIAWLTSLSLHVAGAAALVIFGGAILAPEARRTSAKILLMSPIPETPKVAPLPKPKLRSFQLPKLPKPVVSARQVALPEAPVIQASPTPPAARPLATIPAPAPAPVPQAAPPQIKTGMLDAPQIATTPPTRPAPPVQSAGFAQVVPNEPNRPAALKVQAAGFDQGPSQSAQNEAKRGASVGAFGGPGTAASTPGTARRTVSDGGFGSVSTAGAANPAPPARTARAGFGDAVTAAPQQAAPRTAVPQAVDSNPIEITFKPRPAYTDEARRRQVQGEVVLEVVFTATGEVRVLRVVRGLGHGLDESAVTAANSIRFRPAKQNGRPVDSTAAIRMSFELAF